MANKDDIYLSTKLRFSFLLLVKFKVLRKFVSVQHGGGATHLKRWDSQNGMFALENRTVIRQIFFVDSIQFIFANQSFSILTFFHGINGHRHKLERDFNGVVKEESK